MRALQTTGILACLSLFASAQPERTPVFEVASIKATERLPNQAIFFGPAKGGPGTDDPEHIVWVSVTLRTVLLNALNFKNYQLSGPVSLDTLYDFAVKLPANATKDDVRAMWLNLLTERFGLKLHHEPKEFTVDELVVGKDAPKLSPATTKLEERQADGLPNVVNGELKSAGLITYFRQSPSGVNASVTGKSQTMEALAALLSDRLKHPVIDKTGLTGNYDFKFDYVPEASTLPPPPPPPPGAGPAPAAVPAQAIDPGQSIAVAMQQQLGLRIVKGKANLDSVVVDAVQKTPTEN